MKNTILLLLLSVACMISHGQQVTWVWAQRAGANSDQEGTAAAADAAGNVLITGYISSSSNSFGSITLAAAGAHDIFLAKYDSLGNSVWAKSAGSSSYDQGLDIALDAVGNIYVCGYFESSATFYGSPNITLSSSGGRDIFIAKYNSAGNVLWAKKAGGTGDDAALGICTDGNNVFVTGYFRGSSSFGSITLSSSGGRDVFITSYSASSGTVSWALKGGSSNDDSGESIAISGNSIYITGTYQGASATFASIPGPLSNSGNEDVFLVKYDLSGNGVWKKRAGGSDRDEARSVCANGSSVYVAGSFKDDLDFYNSNSSIGASLSAANGYDAFVAKYDAYTGNIGWVRSEYGSDDDMATGVTVNAVGEVITTGQFKGSLPLGSLPSINASDIDVYATFYDAAGNIINGLKAGGSNADIPAGIAAANNAVYITGHFKSVPSSFGTNTISSVGNEDIFVSKLACQEAAGSISVSSTSICAGDPVTATAYGYSGNVQWQSSAPGSGSWSDIPGATSPVFTFNPNDSIELRTRIGQYPCDVAYSAAVTINVNAYPQLTLTPASPSVCAGDSTTLYATGANTYTWSPATGLSVTAGSIVQASPASGTTYTVTGTSGAGCASSSTISVQVNALPSITVTPPYDTICSGDQAILQATGANNYIWSPATGLSNTSGALVIASPSSSTIYTVTGWDTNGCASSETVPITVEGPLSSNTITGDQDVCSGAQPLMLVGSMPGGGNGTYLYLWEESTDGTTWLPAAGPNSLINYAPPALSDTIYYRRRVMWNSCTGNFSLLSNTVTVRVQPSITGDAVSSDQTICSGSIPVALTGAQPAGGDGNFTYLWMESPDGNTWNPAAGVNNMSSYAPPVLSDTIYYMRTSSSGACTGNYKSSSNIVKITVEPAITGNAVSSPQPVCSGSAPAALSGGTLNGGNNSYSYLWEESADNISWLPAAGINNQPGYSPVVIASDTYYRRTVTSGSCSNSSQPVLITVNPLPAATLSGNHVVCEGDAASISALLTGTAPWSLVYTDGSNSYTLNNITSSSFSWNINPSSSASYILVSVTDSTGCTGTVSGNANVTVYARPTADAGADKEVCGTSISLSASPSMGSGLWSGAPDVIFSDASDPNTAISLPAYGAYTCTWTETNGICTDDDDIQVVAHEPPAAPYAGIDQDIYFAESAEISASAPGAGTGMWSITSGSGSIADPYSPSTTVTHLSNGDVILQWTVTNGTCAPASDEVVLHIKEPMIPSGFSPNNDNSNDRFVIKGIEQASQSSLVILNRWGSEIYKASPYNNEWNGSNQQGESLPEDTYFYVLSMNEKTYTGYIVLKRK